MILKKKFDDFKFVIYFEIKFNYKKDHFFLFLRQKMQPTKVILLMEIMIGSDLGQYQRSMDIRSHRQLLVKDVFYDVIIPCVYMGGVQTSSFIFDQYLQSKVKYSLCENKERQKIHADDVLFVLLVFFLL